jgi:hypothetical protein
VKFAGTDHEVLDVQGGSADPLLTAVVHAVRTASSRSSLARTARAAAVTAARRGVGKPLALGFASAAVSRRRASASAPTSRVRATWRPSTCAGDDYYMLSLLTPARTEPERARP